MRPVNRAQLQQRMVVSPIVFSKELNDANPIATIYPATEGVFLSLSILAISKGEVEPACVTCGINDTKAGGVVSFSIPVSKGKVSQEVVQEIDESTLITLSCADRKDFSVYVSVSILPTNLAKMKIEVKE